MQVLRIGAALLLTLTTLFAATPAQAITECSTPDPRNAYDYCVGTTTFGASVRVLTPEVPSMYYPVCAPAPVVGTVCPPMPDLSSAVITGHQEPAYLTRIYAGAQVHMDTASDVCDAVIDNARYCAIFAIGLDDPTVYQNKGLALTDFEGDGIYEGISVATLQTMEACPLLQDCNSMGGWVFIGAR